VVISNVASGNLDNVGKGWNGTDLAISTVAGATTGLLAGTGVGLVGLVAINSIVGFDASLVSMVAGGRRAPVELAIGAGFGGRGAVLPGGGMNWSGFFIGAAIGSVSNAGQTIITPTSYDLSAPFTVAAKSVALRGDYPLAGPGGRGQ
jgi:hypothetical protein